MLENSIDTVIKPSEIDSDCIRVERSTKKTRRTENRWKEKGGWD
jgi:hypothetical protein